MTERTPSGTQLRADRVAFFAMLAGDGGLLEIRSRDPQGRWLKDFADSPPHADELAHARVLADCDVFVGVLPRAGRAGDAQRRYGPANMLWIDSDTERSVRKVELFDCMPTVVVLSGGLDGEIDKRHNYWRLMAPLTADEVERHLRRLAAHLEGDAASTDAVRILRVPGSRSHKTGSVATLNSFTGEAHELADLTGDLPDPEPEHAEPALYAPARKVPAHERHDALVSLLGCMRRWGEGEEVLVAATAAFCRHQCATDPAVPLDMARAERTARDVARRYPAGPAQSWRQR